jgi:hypothetical protein
MTIHEGPRASVVVNKGQYQVIAKLGGFILASYDSSKHAIAYAKQIDGTRFDCARTNCGPRRKEDAT